MWAASGWRKAGLGRAMRACHLLQLSLRGVAIQDLGFLPFPAKLIAKRYTAAGVTVHNSGLAAKSLFKSCGRLTRTSHQFARQRGIPSSGR